MESGFQHRVLIVEGNEEIKSLISEILKSENIITVFSESGEMALEMMSTTPKIFSLIISAQSLIGMPGTAFLQKVQELSPNATRFLMAQVSEMKTIIKAVNQSAVQRFMIKPFEPQDFLRAVHSGLNLFHSFVEHEKLLSLAKKQNTQLYDLSCELMEATKAHNKTIHELDQEIRIINKQITDFTPTTTEHDDRIINDISHYLSINEKLDEKKAQLLFNKIIKSLFEQFEDLAQRNGFEMLLEENS